MTQTLVSLEAMHEAQARIAGVARRTPLVRLEASAMPGELWLKDEGTQPIGSFKLRGAANAILSLPAAERARGVITYSSGNHAQGVAYAAREAGTRAVIVMPRDAAATKRAATEALGAEIVTVGPASSERRSGRRSWRGSTATR